MRAQRGTDQLVSLLNVLILLCITLTYVVTGTRMGENAVAALSDGTRYRGRASGQVAVECLVSWDARHLDSMLDTLREQDAQITFFVSGSWAKAHAKTLLQMAEDGHEIGTLGFAPSLDGGVDTVAQDVRSSVATIERITGRPVTLYCSGLRDRGTSARAAKRVNVTHIAASTDVLSARGGAEEIAARACKAAFDGSILLIRPTAGAAEALPLILEGIAERGLSVAPVGEAGKETVT